MMHTSTSPLYAIVASNDITSAMMDGSGGRSLTQEVINEAVDFRQAVGRVRREFAKKKDWFFKPWNVETVKEPGGRKVRVRGCAGEMLAQQPGAVDPAPRRQVARLRRHRRRLVHARSDQGQHPLAGHGRGRQAREDRRAGGAGQRLVQPLRHRADARHRFPGDVPVLDRHHAGQVGHAAHQPARVQARLRREPAGRPSRCRRSPRSTPTATATSACAISATSCSNICARTAPASC